MKKWDVFISYASEDKEDIVAELANKLVKNGVKVWYDEFVMKIWDSLSKSINEGIANSKYVLVILTSNYFKKKWTNTEFEAAFSIESLDTKFILPIWHNISEDYLRENCPILLNRIALQSTKGIDYIICEILNLLKSNKKEEYKSHKNGVTDNIWLVPMDAKNRITKLYNLRKPSS